MPLVRLYLTDTFNKICFACDDSTGIGKNTMFEFYSAQTSEDFNFKSVDLLTVFVQCVYYFLRCPAREKFLKGTNSML